jgi:hypothetical protein
LRTSAQKFFFAFHFGQFEADKPFARISQYHILWTSRASLISGLAFIPLENLHKGTHAPVLNENREAIR